MAVIILIIEEGIRIGDKIGLDMIAVAALCSNDAAKDWKKIL